MHEGDEDHIHLDDEGAVAFTGERIELTSVGVDIGSSTSHLIFSDLVLERQGKRLSSRYIVTQRSIRSRSEVIFTPFTPAGQIDAMALGAFIARSYGVAGLSPEDVDGGAVITTGEAALRENARAVADLFSRETGKFVCATAGPNLESLLAAHGSGAVEHSTATDDLVLNVDIGGGTTKFAVCHHGEVRETGAVHLGARLAAWDEDGRLIRLEDAGRRLGESIGIALEAGGQISEEARARLAEAMALIITDIIHGRRREREDRLWITPVLRRRGPFGRIVFSGGVAEYVYARESRDFGDLGPLLAAAVRRRAGADGVVLLEPKEAICATCIGASQYTVQLSGDTIFLSPPDHLPLRNVPVASVAPVATSAPDAISEAVKQALRRLDLEDDGETRFALALQWTHGADYASLRALCEGLIAALPGVRDGRPLVLVLDADVAGLVGALLQEEFAAGGTIVCVDQVALREFDYIDIGRRLPAQGVVPVVVKSLVFH
jgi:ethanolamine utilization protein EutA